MEKIKLPSGSELEVTPAPFADSRALYKAIAAEMINLKMDPQADVDANFWKGIFCQMLASDLIEDKLWACMKRCTYKGLKINQDSFEPVEAREDYLAVCFEVGRVNVSPFTKDLYAKFSDLAKKVQSALV